MAVVSPWRRWGRFAVAAALAAAVGWRAFIAGREVPILDQFDLGIHELGHLLTAFFPTMVMFIAGSFLQVAVPLGLAWYFGSMQRDAAGGGFCLAWAGASMWDVSVYIADAPIQALPLIGGGQHDWAYLLGPRGWDAIHLADEIAGFVEYSGAVLVGAGIVVAMWGMLRGLFRRSDEVVATEALSAPEPEPAGEDPWLEAAKLPFKHEPAA
jgi:hypothetical protein